MTKEEIQAQIDICNTILDILDEHSTAYKEVRTVRLRCKAKLIGFNGTDFIEPDSYVDVLQVLMIENQGLKLYKDNEKKRFEKVFDSATDIKDGWGNIINNVPKYETFEDYYKTLNDD